MERERKWCRILVFKKWETYHIRLNNKWELSNNFDNEENAKMYACWYVDCIDEIQQLFQFHFK